ncbi:hypothetical protein [Symmachiella dynata]|uniref:hypothetical protein n=1 Tax=Symmachiella dynata TaxID=2527995 RepID=UPI0030EF7958
MFIPLLDLEFAKLRRIRIARGAELSKGQFQGQQSEAVSPDGLESAIQPALMGAL